jgi:hypothetical protein
MIDREEKRRAKEKLAREQYDQWRDLSQPPSLYGLLNSNNKDALKHRFYERCFYMTTQR